jgi:hypothetical protein
MLKPCPQCRSLCTIPIVYGEFTDAQFQAAVRGLVHLSDWVVEPSSPTMKCVACQCEWDEGPSSTDADVLAEIREIVECHRNAIFAGMVAESLFSETPGRRSMEAYLRLRDLLGVHGSLNLEAVVNVQRFAAADPGWYAELIDETQAQIAILALRRERSLFDALFSGAVIFMLASPMSRGNFDTEAIREFVQELRTGDLHFE